MDYNNELYKIPGNFYDDTQSCYNSIYDKMPYVWDSDLILERRIIRESGNVIKSYRCLIKDPYEIKNE